MKKLSTLTRNTSHQLILTQSIPDNYIKLARDLDEDEGLNKETLFSRYSSTQGDLYKLTKPLFKSLVVTSKPF